MATLALSKLLIGGGGGNGKSPPRQVRTEGPLAGVRGRGLRTQKEGYYVTEGPLAGVRGRGLRSQKQYSPPFKNLQTKPQVSDSTGADTSGEQTIYINREGKDQIEEQTRKTKKKRKPVTSVMSTEVGLGG